MSDDELRSIETEMPRAGHNGSTNRIGPPPAGERMMEILRTIDGIVWEAAARTLQFSFVSEKAEALLGYPIEQWLTEADFWVKHVHPDDRDATLGACLTATAALSAHVLEYRMIAADGREVWLRDAVRVISENGEAVTLRGIMMDVTEVKRATARLQEQEAEMKILFDLIPAMVLFKDTKNNVLRVNKRAAEKFGLTVKALLEKSYEEMFPVDAARYFGSDLEVIDSGQARLGVVERFVEADGAEGSLQIDKVPFCDAEGRVTGVVVMAQDITEKEQAARDLRRSEARLRAIIDYEPECVKTVSADGHLIEMNPAGLRMIEADSMTEVRGHRMLDLIHPDDRVAFEQLHRKAADGGNGQLQFRIVGLKGTERWMETHSVGLRADADTPASVLSVTRDITVQRRAEETRLLQANVLDHVGEAVIAADLEGKVIYANRSAGELYGWMSLAEMSGTDIFEVTIAKSSREHAHEFMQAAGKGEKWSGELVCRRRNGTEFAACVTSSPLLDEKGKVIGVVGIYTDISEQKEAQTTLRESESDLENAQRIAHVGSWKWDVATDRLEASAEVYRIFGVAPEAARSSCGMLMQAVHPADLPKVEKAFAEAMAGREPYNIDHRVRRPDGSERVVNGAAEVTFDAAGTPVRVTGTVQDITRRTKIDAELRRGADRIHEQAALLDLAHDAIMVRSMDDRVLYWNHGAETLYGWTAAEVIGKPTSTFLRTDEPAAVVARAALLEHGHWAGECRHLCKVGGHVIVRSRWTLVTDDQCLPQSILVINTDITEQKKVEEQFLRAQRLESIGTLASGVAHDLNNILAPILMSAPLLHSNLTSEVREKIISTIEQSAERGAQIVKQVLTFARGVEGERVLIDPTHLIKEMVSIAQQTFPKSIRVTSRFPESLWLIEGDPTQLHQILLNLSVNARDAMPNGGTLVLAAENFEVDEHYASMMPDAKPGLFVLLTATDSGSGMPRDVIDKIFAPFFTTKDVGVGTGLGLSTVLGIVKSHGGFIAVESEPGHGSTFKIFLRASSGNMPAEAAKESVPEGSGETILVIDDEPAILSVTKMILESHNYHVLRASDGPEALGIFAQQMGTIDLVVTDLLMPFMDGVAVVRAMKKMKPDVKVIASTGQDEQARLSELEGLGVAVSLPKPYNRAKLLKTLHEVLAPEAPASVASIS